MRVVVSELGETPLDAIERHMALVPTETPTNLSPRDAAHRDQERVRSAGSIS